MERCPAYISNINLDSEKQLILFLSQMKKKKADFMLQLKLFCIIERNNFKTC